MALGRGRRDRGGIEAWPGYVDALSTLLMVIIFVLLVFVLSQGFLSVALSSRDRALDRLNRQVAELGELLALERGQAEELRGALGRTAEELRAATAARDAAQRSLALLRDERDRLAAERDTTRGERDRLAARIADLEAASRGGAARIAELESRLAEALARTEAVGGDAARTARTLTEAQRLLAAEQAALEAVRRSLAATQQQAAALGRDLDAERRARESRERDLAATQTLAQGLQRDLAAERQARETREAELAQSRQQAQALTRDLAETRTARDTAARERDVTRQELEARRQEAATLARDLAAARQSLEAARRDIAALRDEAQRLDRTVQADRATIEARLSDIARLSEQVRALEALRDQLERQAAQAMARASDEERQRSAAQRAAEEAARARAAAEALVAQATGRAEAAERERSAAAQAAAEAERQRAAAAQRAAEAAARAAEEERRRLASEGRAGEFARLSESARAQVALLTRQLEELRAEIGRLSAALDLREAETRDRDAQIALLGQRLNAALAQRVEELQSYRSDFFGRLRRVLGDRPEVRIVGDRFVFQSEVLFPVGGAELSPAGAQQIRDLGRVLLDLAGQFPRDLAWVLRVDGHADRSPIRGGGRFASNWELSAARAIAVAQLLIAEGLPPNRVAAAAFGDTQPLDDRDTPEAYARNRRIELRLEAGPAAQPAQQQGSVQPGGVQPVAAPGRSLAEAVRELDCARVAMTEGAGGPVLAGVGLRGTPARLRAALPAGAQPRLAIAEFEGPFCGLIEALGAVEPGGVRLAQAGSGPLPRGSLLRVDLGLPDWAAHAMLVFVANDGQVVHLERLDRQAPGARLRLGEPRPGFAGWAVDEPFGTDLVLAIASEGPLFATPRPDVEDVRDFAPALRDAVATARAAGRRVATGALVVEVVPR